MSRRKVTITTSWVLISARNATFTIQKIPLRGGKLLFNDTASDDAAQPFTTHALNQQIVQVNEQDTFVRSTTPGWEVLVDD